MLKKYDEVCDSLDACVFNGELVTVPENRKDFKKYLDRWRKEVEEWDELEEWIESKSQWCITQS